MTTFRVRLADDETALLERLVAAHPEPLRRADCDAIAVGNLVAIGCAAPAVGCYLHVFVTDDGLALWETRTPRPPTEATLMQLVESNGGDVAIAVPDVVSYALSTGILIGYQLGSADALERDGAS